MKSTHRFGRNRGDALPTTKTEKSLTPARLVARDRKRLPRDLDMGNWAAVSCLEDLKSSCGQVESYGRR
jgi:hypothetical protein